MYSQLRARRFVIVLTALALPFGVSPASAANADDLPMDAITQVLETLQPGSGAIVSKAAAGDLATESVSVASADSAMGVADGDERSSSDKKKKCAVAGAVAGGLIGGVVGAKMGKTKEAALGAGLGSLLGWAFGRAVC